jgi:hypothetical protein
MVTNRPLKDQDLGENDDEEDFAFPPAERRVITQPLDLSVQTLLEQGRPNSSFCRTSSVNMCGIAPKRAGLSSRFS